MIYISWRWYRSGNDIVWYPVYLVHTSTTTVLP